MGADDGDATRSEGGERPARRTLAPGSVLGRYVVERELGRGGMGVVYAAHDLGLGRRVAIKLMPGGGGRGGRLLAEARAMARLTHPQIVAVLDVGVADGQLFVAMELVDGATARSWLAEKPRSAREIVALYVQAGRGLAAAHRAGVVHRDFKPDNVLVAKDGSARVSDFGVARLVHGSDDGPREPTVTGTGSRSGTPAYMAPEVHLGEAADAQSDQFSFCVTLYEALYGERPFAGETQAELAEQTQGGKVREPKAGSAVPSRLRRALLRGLSVDRARRYPSLEALLDQLGRDPAAGRRKIALAALGLGALAAAAFGWHRAAAPEPCAGAGAGFDRALSSERRAQAHAAFSATGLPYADAAWQSTARALDGYGARYRAARVDACRATRIRGEQSEELLDLRMQCFDDRLRQVDALAALYARADREVVERAVQAIDSLPPLAACDDVAALKAGPRAQPPPEMAARVSAAAAKVAEGRALRSAGKYREALVVAKAADAEARATSFRPAIAAAQFLVAQLTSEVDDPKAASPLLEEALFSAEAAGDNSLTMLIWTDRIYLEGYLLGRYDRAHEAAGHARAALERMGGDRDLESRLLHHVAAVEEQEGQYDRAEADFRRAVELAEQLQGKDNLAVADSVDALGTALTYQGKLDEALALLERARATTVAQLSADHPLVAARDNDLGMALESAGRHKEALAAFRRALSVRERAFGDGSADVGTSWINVGVAETGLGDFAAAAASEERALAIHEQVSGPDHPLTAMALVNLATAENGLGRFRDAERHADRSLAINSKAFGPEHPNVAECLIERGRSFEKRDPKRALADIARGLALQEKVLGAEHPDLSAALLALAEAQLDTSDPQSARQTLERALALRGPRDPAQLDEIRAALDRARAKLAHR